VLTAVRRVLLAIGLSGIAILVAALATWGAFVLALSLAGSISGWLGESLAAILATVLLVVGCVAAAQGANWARGVWLDRVSADRQAALKRALHALGHDAARAHWLPLATRYRSADPAMIARWEARYRALLADPRRMAFAARALDGEFPTDAEIDYALEPERRQTCVHLRPLEDALRHSGLPMGPLGDRSVWTECRIDAPAAIARFGLSGVQWVVPELDPRNPDPGWMECARCGSRVHGGEGAPFPATAGGPASS
jgi:hypothetical protein